MIWNYQLNQPSQDTTLALSIVKTIAAFMNTDGGNLVVGVDDKSNILGIEKD
jgi:predicted HTH transcriptional regulator